MNNRKRYLLRVLLNYGILFLCVLALAGVIFWFTRACVPMQWA